MNCVTEEMLEKMFRVIVDAADPEQIILFGSRSTSDSREGSDVDLLIVESHPFDRNRSRRKEMARLWRLLAPIPVAKDLLLSSRDEVEYWKKSLNDVVARALRTGRILYERS